VLISASQPYSQAIAKSVRHVLWVGVSHDMPIYSHS